MHDSYLFFLLLNFKFIALSMSLIDSQTQKGHPSKLVDGIIVITITQEQESQRTTHNMLFPLTGNTENTDLMLDVAFKIIMVSPKSKIHWENKPQKTRYGETVNIK